MTCAHENRTCLHPGFGGDYSFRTELVRRRRSRGAKPVELTSSVVELWLCRDCGRSLYIARVGEDSQPIVIRSAKAAE